MLDGINDGSAGPPLPSRVGAATCECCSSPSSNGSIDTTHHSASTRTRSVCHADQARCDQHGCQSFRPRPPREQGIGSADGRSALRLRLTRPEPTRNGQAMAGPLTVDGTGHSMEEYTTERLLRDLLWRSGWAYRRCTSRRTAAAAAPSRTLSSGFLPSPLMGFESSRVLQSRAPRARGARKRASSVDTTTKAATATMTSMTKATPGTAPGQR